MAGYQGTSTRRDPHEALAAMTEAARRGINTTLPGTIVSYDPARQKATVKPRLKQKFGDTTLDAPDLLEVPVQFPRAGGFILHKPPAAGDEVTLHFAQRSLEPPVDSGEASDGYPARMHDMSDAVAVPAAHSKAKELPNLPADKLHLGSEDGKKGMQVGKDGKVALVGGPDGGEKIVVDQATGKVDMKANGESLSAILRDFVTVFRDHLHATVPMDSPYIATANALLARLNSMGL
jgi:hypothetical protein